MPDHQPMCGVATAAFRIHRYEPDREGVGDLDIPRPQLYLVHNRTPWQIRVEEHECGEFQVSPLGERLIAGERLQMFEEALIPLRQRHYLRVRPHIRTDRNNRLPWFGIVAAAGIAAVIVGYTFIVDGTVRRLNCGLAGIGFALVLTACLVWAWRSESNRVQLEEFADREEGDSVFGSGGSYYSGNETERAAWQTMALVTVLVVAVVLPAIAIFFGTDLQDLVTLDGGLAITESIDENAAWRRVVSRVIQITYVAILTLFPALMYFQFDRVRVGTLRGQWVRNIFRLDGRMRNLADVQATYGDQLAEASSFSTDSVRLLGGKRSPIVVATVLLALGWTLLVLPTRSRDFQSALSAEVALEEAQDHLAEASAQRDLAVAAAATAGGGREPASPGVATAAEAAQAAAQQAEAGAEAAAEFAEAGSAAGAAPATTTGGGDGGDETGGGNGGDETGGAGGGAGETVPGSNDAAVESAEAAVANAHLAVQDAQARLATAQGGDFFQLLTPRPSTAAMAFLGAYFFAVYLVLRGYLRGDLRPKVYNQITTRLVTVVIIGYLFNVLYPGLTNRAVLGTAFVAGIVPRTFLRALGEQLHALGSKWGVRSLFGQAFAEQRLLSTIDGIDIYERERLATEGINDIEALAHADIVGLMVDTRLPLERIVDWVDQAVLQLYVNPPDLEGGKRSPELIVLHEMGVRTASDVLRIEDAFQDGAAGAQEERALLVDAFGSEARLRILVVQIRSEPATGVISQWSTSEFADPRSPHRYLDRTGEFQPYDQEAPPSERRSEDGTDGNGAADAVGLAAGGNGHAAAATSVPPAPEEAARPADP